MIDKSLQDEVLRLDRQLCFALYATSKLVTQVYQPILEPLGITYPQYLVFLVLWENDRISLKELGSRLYLDSGTLTPLLKRLEHAGFLTRTRSAEDERELRIILTEKGRALKEKARDIPHTLQCEVGLGSDDVGKILNNVKGLLKKMQRHRRAD